MGVVREGLPEGLTLKLDTYWMKSQPCEEWGTVFQAEETACTEALRWRNDQLDRNVVMEEDREVSRALLAVEVF